MMKGVSLLVLVLLVVFCRMNAERSGIAPTDAA